jgi:YHS domain-containing protein/thiol-disulfide isomerase/thioredoxin
MQIRWIVLSLSIFSFSAAARAGLTPTDVWGHDLAAAEAEAAKLQRPLVIHFHASYCGPCKRMEKELLHTPQVLKTLDAGFVAVKVDLQKHQKIGQRFNVTGMPTDVILGPDGKKLARTEGYDPEGTVKQQWLQNLARVDGQFAKAGKRLPRQSPVGNDQPQLASNSTSPKQERAVVSADKLVPQPTEPHKVDAPRESTPSLPKVNHELDGDDAAPAAPEIQVAMDGFCPVTLRNSRTWKKGDKDLTFEHEGQVYFFTASEKLAEFKANPDKFAPRVLGCDPVKLTENNLAVRGSTKYGAFYEGALFLFESAESRSKFKQTPIRYSQLKHALKPSDVKRVASTAGN